MSDPFSNEVASPGGTLGSRIAKLVADGHAYSKLRTGDHVSRLGSKIFTDVTNHVSDEVRGVMGPLFREAAEHPETPPEARPLLRALGNERGQAWAWIGGTATGAALGGGLMNLLTNYMNPTVLPLIAANPLGVLSPSDAAQAEARGIHYSRSWSREAAYSGIDRERFNALVAMNQLSPTADQLMVLVNRGRVAGSTATTLLRNQGYRGDMIDEILSLREVDLSAEQLAAMFNRGIISAQRTRDLGNRVGYSDTDMDWLMQLGGDPPAVAELLLAWRRGIIDESDVDRALRQGPLRFEWINVIKSLQWEPLPLGEAADAVNQGHLSMGKARRVAREHGVRDDDFDVLIANAGLPPGPQETLDWVNRGILTEAQGLQALYESRIKNKWVPKYMESRHETMPPETVRLMFSRGAIGRNDALRRLQMRGYSAEDSAILLDGASAEKTAATRDLTQSQIRELYSERAINRNDAVSWLTELGYEAGEAVWILELADFQRIRRFVTAATNRIRSGYVMGHFDETHVSGLLDQLGIPSDQRDDMLFLWDIERATVTKGLTTSQIQQAFKRGLLGEAEAMSRLIGQGYADSDAAILLQLVVPAQEAN